MAAKKKVETARRRGPTKKKQKSTGALLKKKRASVAKAKAKASPRTKVRIVKQKVGKQRTARLKVGPKGKLIPQVKKPRIGSTVVTEHGTIGKLVSINADGIATLDIIEGAGVTATVAASKLFIATEGEKRVHAFMAKTAVTMVDVLTNGDSDEAEVSEAIEKVHAETTEAERLAVVAAVIKPGAQFNVVERAEDATDSDVRVSPDPEAARAADLDNVMALSP